MPTSSLPIVNCFARCGAAHTTKTHSISCGSTSTTCGGNWKPTQRARSTSSPNRAWDTGLGQSLTPLGRLQALDEFLTPLHVFDPLLTSQRLVSECGVSLQQSGLDRGCVNGPTILLVDDEAPLRQVLRARLTARGYSIQEASSGEEVLRTVPSMQPDVIILDIGLPGIDGIEVTRRLRTSLQTPIIILSVHAAEADKIAALDAGADDYLTKPCDLGELLDRIRTALYRVTLKDADVFTSGDLVVDMNRQTVHAGNVSVLLTETEYSLLKVLVLNAGKLLTQDWLANEVWGERSTDALQMLRTTIRSLRQKLDTNSSQPGHIATEPGVGYR